MSEEKSKDDYSKRILKCKIEDPGLKILIERIMKVLNLKSRSDTWSNWFLKWLPFMLLWLCGIRFFALMVLFDRVPNISLYLGDFLSFFLSGRIELYIITVMNSGQLCTSNGMLLINLSPAMRAQLLRICDLLSGSITPDEFGFTDVIHFTKYHQRSKIILNLIFFSNLITNTCIFLPSFILCYLSYTTLDFFIFGLPWIILSSLLVLYMVMTIGLLAGFLLISCIYMAPQLSAIKNELDQVLMKKRFKSSKFLKYLLTQLDSFYSEINDMNGYWKYFIFSVYFTIIPNALLLLDIVLFEKVNTSIIIGYSLGIITTLLFLSVNFLSASLVSDQQLVLYSRFNSIMTNVRLPFKLKYQLMLTIERLGCLSYPHQMGFTCHHLFTVDYRLIKDTLLYCLGLFLLIRGVSVSLSVNNSSIKY